MTPDDIEISLERPEPCKRAIGFRPAPNCRLELPQSVHGDGHHSPHVPIPAAET
jgi:hypothetical protein